MARTVTTEQSFTLINDLYEQLTGQKPVTAVDISTFNIVANKVLSCGYNQVITGISEMLRQARVSIRPYSAPFRLTWYDEDGYAAHTRIISYLEGNADAQENPTYTLKDGGTIGSHIIKLPKVYQTNITGRDTFQAFVTITKEQVKTAFRGPGELASFFTGLMQDIENQLEQQREAACRANLLNLVGAAYSYKADPDSNLAGMTVHLFTEYKAKYGNTAATLTDLRKSPQMWEQFIKYCFQRVEQVSKHFTLNDVRYHINPTEDPKGGNILRHTPASMQRAYFLDEYTEEINTQVLTNIWNREYLKQIPHETVLYWQGVDKPDQVKVTPNVFQKNGTAKVEAAQTISALFGVLFDKEACGVGLCEEDTTDTPYDAERHCLNRYWSKVVAPWNDHTQKFCIFLMD